MQIEADATARARELKFLMMSLSPEITRLLQYNRQVRLVVGGFVRERERPGFNVRTQ